MKNFDDVEALRSVLQDVTRSVLRTRGKALPVLRKFSKNSSTSRYSPNEMIVKTPWTRHNPAVMQPRIGGRLCQTPIRSRPAFHRMEPPGRERHRRVAHLGERAGANESNALQRGPRDAFTLIELLVVIAIIAILIGLLFPAFRAVQDQAKRTQAKNDLTQIVNAVNAFYTEYGRYPVDACALGNDKTLGPGGSPTNNETLFAELRACPNPPTGSCLSAATLNTRQIVFISPPDVKDGASPRSGIGTSAANKGQYFDPWGNNYVIRIDCDYNNQVANPYTANAGASPLSIGVIAWSLGKDGTQGGDFSASDDVISWQ